MAQSTKTRSASSSNGSASSGAGLKVKEAGDTVASTARRVRMPVLVAGATAAGLAGGLALGSRKARKRRGMVALVGALGKAASELGSVGSQLSETRDEARQIRKHLENANKRSPIEVVLDGLTHRRGAHKL